MVLASATAIGAAGCEDGAELVPGDAAPVTRSEAGTSSPPAATPTTTAPGTSAPPATSTAPATSTTPPVSPVTTPGALPSGAYDVLVKSVDPARRRLSVDVVDYLTGDPAVRACREDGGHGSGESGRNGYLRNTPTPVRTLAVAGNATVTMSIAIKAQPTTLTAVAGQLPGRNLYTMRVAGGQVSRLDEIYRP